MARIGGRLLMWLIHRSWVTLLMPVPGTPARCVLRSRFDNGKSCLECWISDAVGCVMLHVGPLPLVFDDVTVVINSYQHCR
jgi:hypothetical protein